MCKGNMKLMSNHAFHNIKGSDLDSTTDYPMRPLLSQKLIALTHESVVRIKWGNTYRICSLLPGNCKLPVNICLYSHCDCFGVFKLIHSCC